MENLPLEKIKPDPYNPRQYFNPVEMRDLEKSIKAEGIITPLSVMVTDKKNEYLLLDGERRYRAATNLKLKEVPVRIFPKMSSSEIMIFRFHVQEQHKSWDVFDKALAASNLMKEQNLTVKQTAEALGFSYDTIKGWTGLLALSKRTQETARNRKIPPSYLTVIAGIVQDYTYITKMPREEIETILLEKLESRAIVAGKEFNLLKKLINSEEVDNEKKLKFLKDFNYTVSNFSDETPEGNSIRADKLVANITKMTTRLNHFLQQKDGEFNEKQEARLRALMETLGKIV